MYPNRYKQIPVHGQIQQNVIPDSEEGKKSKISKKEDREKRPTSITPSTFRKKYIYSQLLGDKINIVDLKRGPVSNLEE